MSYLDTPRLHFAGLFRADVCTVNNNPDNYAPGQIKYKDPRAGGFNPYGTGNWTIEQCTVRSVVYGDGSLSNDKHKEPLIHQPVSSLSPGKLVDLDPQQMMVSEIWGLRILIGDDQSPDFVHGHFQVAPFMDIWTRAPGQSGGRDFAQSAFYQSVLTDLTWSTNLQSPFLGQLQEASSEALSIKFTVDGYNMTQGDPHFTYGRIVGSIGPVLAADEPVHFVADRLLRTTRNSTLNNAPFRVFTTEQKDGTHYKVQVDLGNSIPTHAPGGAPAIDNHSLSLVLYESSVPTLGTIVTTAAAYTDRALIQEFDLNEVAQKHGMDLGELVKFVTTIPMAVVDKAKNYLLVEDLQGTLIRAEKYVYRLNPGHQENGQVAYPESEEERTVNLRICQFGSPLKTGKLSLYDASDQLQGGSDPTSKKEAEEERTSPVGIPKDALGYPEAVEVADGKASFVLQPSDPGSPRAHIDGQIYGVGYRLAADRDKREDEQKVHIQRDLFNFVSVIVHTLTTWDRQQPPTWWAHIEPIFSQYARLYPVMREKGYIDLGSYTHVTGDHNRVLQVMFSEKPENPAYMPVTRDLSKSKHEMIMAWFQAGMPEGERTSE